MAITTERGSTATIGSPRHAAVWLSAGVVFGAMSGAAAKVTDQAGIQWLSDLTSLPALWVLLLVLISRATPSSLGAAVLAGAYFTGLCVGYYAWTSLVLHFPVGHFFAAWTIAAVTVAPCAAAIVNAIFRHAGTVGGLLLAVVASATVLDGSVHRAWLGLRGLIAEEAPARTAQAIFALASAVVIACLATDKRARIVAVLALPMTVPIAVLVATRLGDLLVL